jgi:effector-binding domain-containing protein
MLTTPSLITTTAQPFAYIHLLIPGQDMGRYMDPAIQEVLQVLAAQGLQPAGPLVCLHNRRPTDTFDFLIGFPVAQRITEQGRVRNGEVPAATVVRAEHHGPYEHLAGAWQQLQTWVQAQQLNTTERFWEAYLNDPSTVAGPQDYRTELNWVVA